MLTPVKPTVAHPAWFSSPLLHTARNTARDLTPVQLPMDSTALQRSIHGSQGPAGSAGGGQVTLLPAQQTPSLSPKDSSKQSLQNQVKYQWMISSTGISNFVFLRSDKKGKKDFPLNVSLKIFQQLTHKAFRHFNFQSSMNTLNPNETY